VPLLFTAHAARDLGASRIGLVAPNLGYMRQDKRFCPGEAITSSAFGKLLSSSFDWLVTLDPHLHRRTSMSEVYSIPVGVCHAAPKLSAWIRAHAPNALVVGPDVESEQWVGAVAAVLGYPASPSRKRGAETATSRLIFLISKVGRGERRFSSMTSSPPARL
jgi:ribose-phosphate pyrophosphokinase